MKPAQAYLAIRIAMMSGLLMFGAVSWFLHQRPDWQPSSGGVVDNFVTIGKVMWGVAAAALVVLFFQHRKADTPVKVSTLSIIAWTVGEALALFGAVHFYLSGISTWYVAGLVAMSITFIAFRPPVLR